MLLAVGLVGAMALADEPRIPEALEPRLAGLSESQREFLLSDGPLRFASRHELLFQRLELMQPDAVVPYVEAMIQVVEDLRFDPERDWDAIPLNTEPPPSTFTG